MSRTVSEATRKVKEQALALGFTDVGVARAEALEVEGTRLLEWLGRGYQASMDWMERRVHSRTDPRAVMPEARSVIAVALNYYTPEDHVDQPGIGRISRYAWGDDYHNILLEKLAALSAWIREEYPGSATAAYVDTGPVMDKAWAARAGLGWLGKHTNIITRDVGSWVFLGELITTLELEPDAPAVDHCGTCTLCIEACPTQAIVEPYVVDANRCISYLTIEHRGPIRGEIAGELGRWIFGCDVCQDVCPWNTKFAVETNDRRFFPREGFVTPSLPEWQEMTQKEFAERFRGSAVKRAKRDGLLRNIHLGLTSEAQS